MGSSSSKANAEVWERYEPKRFLGNGASAHVYVAKDRSADVRLVFIYLFIYFFFENIATFYETPLYLPSSDLHCTFCTVCDF
jgi:hypothetical protein